MKTELVITFHTTEDALRTEAILKKAQIPGRLIPVPPSIHGDCGLAFRTPLNQEHTFRELLDGQVVPQGFYSLEFRW